MNETQRHQLHHTDSLGPNRESPNTPSNVTRMARSLRRICSDGVVQIIECRAGVGASSFIADILSGGAFGLGISEVGRLLITILTPKADVCLKSLRSACSFICANYSDEDEILLIGFSRCVSCPVTPADRSAKLTNFLQEVPTPPGQS